MSDDNITGIKELYCDDDSMKSHFDVIVVGTGLTESILACILAKHGNSVLHLDSNDFYGKSLASHSLNSLFELCESGLDDSKSSQANESPRGFKVIDFFNPFHALSDEGQSFEDKSEKLEVLESLDCLEVIVTPVNEDSSKLKERIHKLIDLKKQSRRFNIDFPSTGLIFSSGDFVNFLIKSKTSNYLEFQSLDGLYYLQSTRGSNALTSQTELFSVPCSKGDVFQSKLLNVFEKRTLMKFLQAVADWGRLEAGIEVHTLNEVDLAQGRSLHRPQNKELSVNEFNFADFMSMSFLEILDIFKLSTKLKEIVCYSLCLYSDPISSDLTSQISAKKGLGDLYRHLSSLGKFGDSAFLTPLYGSGELSQAFCRMCAVWGGTYILRRSVTQIEELKAPFSEIIEQGEVNDDKPACVTEKRFSITDSEGKLFTCSKLIINTDEWPEATTSNVTKPKMLQRFVLSHVAIFDTTSFSDDIKPKSLIIIPPEAIAWSTFSNKNTIFVLQLDSSISIVPKGYVYLAINTEVELLSQDDQDGIQHCKILLASVLTSLSLRTSCEESLCHVTTLKPLRKIDDVSAFSRSCFAVTQERTLSLSPDVHLEEAQEIFASMFPGLDFVKDSSDELATDSEFFGGTDAETESDFKQLESTLQAIQQSQLEQNTIFRQEVGDTATQKFEECSNLSHSITSS